VYKSRKGCNASIRLNTRPCRNAIRINSNAFGQTAPPPFVKIQRSEIFQRIVWLRRKMHSIRIITPPLPRVLYKFDHFNVILGQLLRFFLFCYVTENWFRRRHCGLFDRRRIFGSRRARFRIGRRVLHVDSCGPSWT